MLVDDAEFELDKPIYDELIKNKVIYTDGENVFIRPLIRPELYAYLILF